MKPARDYDIRYGRDLVKEDSAQWPRYVAISTPTAWRTAQPYFAQEPAAVGFNKWLDRTHLQEVADSLPDDVDLVVGVGGGRALDHAKYVAHRKGKRLLLVPTIVSTGAIIHGICGNWTGRVMDGFICECYPEYVLVDYDLVKAAPERLNTAGIGDVLCGYAGLCEWRHTTQEGIGEPFDPDVAAVTMEHHAHIVENFPRTFAADGSLTVESVRFIMQTVQDRDDKMLRHPAAPASDHSFCFALEWANDRFWIHGEETALGAVVVAWHTDQSPETVVEWLDRCKVQFRPRHMGISKEEMRRGLAAMPEWMSDTARGRDVDSIMRREPLTGARFEDCWAWLSRI